MWPTVVPSSWAKRLSSSWVSASIRTLVVCMQISIQDHWGLLGSPRSTHPPGHRRRVQVVADGCRVEQTPIGPGQHFLGLVNGSNAGPVTVRTVCAGPTFPGRTGAVAGGQTMSVAEVASAGGYTGFFSHVYSWCVPTTTVPAATARTATRAVPVQLEFTEYGAPQPIPTSVRVPCDGSGTVEFSSCPYLAPCAFGWVPNYVKVPFVNIAL